MANSLREFCDRERGAASQLAARSGIAPADISRYRSGKHRPSPEVAKRIETATAGQVTAASLLGLDVGATGEFRQRSDGKWVGAAGERGAALPMDLMRTFGLQADEPLLFEVVEDGFQIVSVRKRIRRAQDALQAYKVEGVSVVDEFIAERRAEAARE